MLVAIEALVFCTFHFTAMHSCESVSEIDCGLAKGRGWREELCLQMKATDWSCKEAGQIAS